MAGRRSQVTGETRAKGIGVYLFISDLLDDEALAECSAAAFGVWVRIFLTMIRKGSCWAPGDLGELAKWLGKGGPRERMGWIEDNAGLIQELESAAVFARGMEIDEHDSEMPRTAIVCRRLWREKIDGEHLASKRKRAGKAGAAARWKGKK